MTLVAGLLFGPAVLGLVQPELLGVTLRVVVRAAVAVVVFERGLLLNVGELRHTSRAVVGLVSAGLLITTVLAGLLVNLLLGWSWELSLLFGAIVSVTGPTVITPILQKVRVNRRVRTTLESESVIADPLGVILAALVFAVVLATVLIEGSAVGWLARRFKVMPKHTIIVGADETGRLLAAELNRAGETVSLIDLDAPNGSTRLKEGDVLTLIGGESAVHSAREKLDSTS